MENSHLHLMLCHVPIFTVLFGTAFYILNLFKKNIIPEKIIYVILIIGGISSFASVMTGEMANEYYEKNIPQLFETTEAHEESAEKTNIIVIDTFYTKSNKSIQVSKVLFVFGFIYKFL